MRSRLSCASRRGRKNTGAGLKVVRGYVVGGESVDGVATDAKMTEGGRGTR